MQTRDDIEDPVNTQPDSSTGESQFNDLPPLPSNQSPWRDDLNNYSRWVDNDKAIGSLVQSAVACDDLAHDSSDTSTATVGCEVQTEYYIGTGAGLIMGTLLHWMIRRRYPQRRSLNPLYRNFKVLAGVGSTLGNTIGYALPLPKNLQKIIGATFSDIFSIVLAPVK